MIVAGRGLWMGDKGVGVIVRYVELPLVISSYLAPNRAGKDTNTTTNTPTPPR